MPNPRVVLQLSMAVILNYIAVSALDAASPIPEMLVPPMSTLICFAFYMGLDVTLPGVIHNYRQRRGTV